MCVNVCECVCVCVCARARARTRVCMGVCVCVRVCSDPVLPVHKSKYQPITHLRTVYTSDVNPAPVPVDQTARCRDDGAGPPGQWAARQPRATVRTQNIRNHVAPSPAAAAAAAASPGPPPGSWPAEPPPAYPGMGPVYLAQPMGTPVAVVGWIGGGL